MEHWFAKWFFKSYLLALTTHGGAIWVFIQFLGYSDSANTYLRNHRAAAVVCLVIHFVLTLTAEMCSNSKREIADLRERELKDDEQRDQ